MKRISTFLVLLLCLVNVGLISKVYGQTPATSPYSQDFSTANDFTFVNGSQTNKWAYGTATGNPASSIYISNNNGTANAYSTGSSSVTQAYRDIAVPAGSTIANLSFNWKGAGESTYDYLRVWLVPATFTPTAGTQIGTGTGRVQLGQFNQQSAWQTYTNAALDVSAYAGNAMRLVFEWRNDGSLGTQPPAAIDNISFSIPTCIFPSGGTVTTITTTNATLNWTTPTPAPANGYAYYITTTNTPPTAGTAPTGTASGTSITLTNLTPNTTYYWWVRSVCSPTDNSLWLNGESFTTMQVPATLPYSQNFSTVNDFGFINGSQVNKWVYGSATGNPANSIYISNNGTANAYSTGTSSVTQAYRDIAIPAGTTDAILSFDWKAAGESTYDYIRVWLVPSTFMPTSGTQITAGANRVQLAQLNQQSAWQNYINTSLNLSAYAGTNMRLVFEWRNDASGGTQPPAAIDNINLVIPTCKVPTAIAVSTITATAATLSWTAPTPAPANGYAYYITTTNTPPTAGTTPTGTTTGTSVTLTNLSPNTTYYFWVKSVCSATDSSLWMPGPSFTTTQIPATVPYNQNFSTGNDFGFVNGTQVNKWFYGSATGNPANSIYISNNNGAANAYSTGTSSVTQAYRDIAIPAGSTIASLSFDWKAAGESTYDYLRVWLVPSSFMPTAGTQITAGAGRIQLGNTYNQQTAWQTYLNPTLDISSFAGNTMRLVFEWRNDSSGGTQPPVAIDNVRLLICSNAVPTGVNVSAITHNSATVTWSQDNGGASYIIRYRPVNTTNWSTMNVAAATATTNTANLINLQSATLYEVEVAAVCNGAAGNYSHNEFTTKCDPTPPNVTVSAITTTSALITWSPLAASSTYVLRYRIVGSGNAGWSANINLPNAPANSYTLQGLNVYTAYEVQIANICNGDTTLNPWSNPQVFTTERTCDIAPPGLTITNLTPTTAEVTWDPFPGTTYILRYRKVGIPSWTSVPVATNTHTLTGLLELTQYEMQVANVCSGNSGNYTQPYVFTTPTVTYCRMASANSSSEYISKVTVTPNGKPKMENPSVASNYTDFTGVPLKFIELVQGSSNNQISIDKSLAGGTNAGVAVWIDFNRNGYFDINERILVSGPNDDTTVNGTFSVPADAFISMTDYKYVVMRVAMQKDGIPVNCVDFQNGEVEDYTVRISKQAVPNALNQTDILIYPNPVSSVLYVKNISKKANYKLYSAAGQLVSTGIILNNKIDVSKLINGVYVIDIEDAQGTAQKKFIKK